MTHVDLTRAEATQQLQEMAHGDYCSVSKHTSYHNGKRADEWIEMVMRVDKELLRARGATYAHCLHNMQQATINYNICPECGSSASDGVCSSPARHNGGVE